MNGLCWEAGCSIRGLLPAGAEARCSSTGRCGGRGGGCWEGKRSSWAGRLARGPSRLGLHHREEAPVGLRGATHSESMERSQGHYPLGKEDRSGPCALPPLAPMPQPKLTALVPGVLSSVGLGGSFLPSPELARGSAGSYRESPLTHRGRGWPPSHCQSPWSHQGWQRGGGAGPGLTTLGSKQINNLRHTEVQSLAPLGIVETESNLSSLILRATMSTTPLYSISQCALWVWAPSWALGIQDDRSGTGSPGFSFLLYEMESSSPSGLW